MTEAVGQQDDTEIEEIDVIRISELIPHRYPFLMIDRMRAIKPDHSAVGIKNVTVNESYFAGHFPSRPVMPGVLIIEAMAQTAASLVAITQGHGAGEKMVYFMTIDNARFRKPVVPGDQLEVVVEKVHHRGQVWKFSGKAYVDGASVADAVFSAMLMDN